MGPNPQDVCLLGGGRVTRDASTRRKLCEMRQGGGRLQATEVEPGLPAPRTVRKVISLV